MKRWKNTDNTPVVLLLRSLPPVNIVNVCCPSNNLTFPRLMQCFLRLSVYIEALYGNNCLSALFHYVKNSLSSMKPKLAYISLLKPVLSLWSIGSCLSDFSRVYRRQTVIWKSSQISWKANLWAFHWAESFKFFTKLQLLALISSYPSIDITFYEHAPNTVPKRMEIMIHFMRT